MKQRCHYLEGGDTTRVELIHVVAQTQLSVDKGKSTKIN
jgi:protein-disulfide isomerase-like protein with CxxC motif